jgi:WD40 repeat protein
MTAAVAGAVVGGVNPYPGLAPFDEQDASRFFGRDREIEELLDRMSSRRILAVIGVSGCGKSSLVRAGVIPILKMGIAPNLPARWRIITITPGNDPLASLRLPLDAAPEWPVNAFDLIEQGRKKLQAGETLLFIVDQFEELFRYRDDTFGKDAGNAASLFVNLLLNAIDQREVPIYVLLTMRTDFLGRCTQFRGLPEALNDSYYLVPRLTRLQQQQAIEQPLQEQGVVMNPVLAQRLLNDSAEDPDHLPVLQHLLKSLWESWERRGHNGRIETTDYHLVGGWMDCLNADAESVFKRLEPDQDGVRRLFQGITERGPGEQPIRRPRSFSECIDISGLTRERLTAVVEAFQERGLIRASDLSDKSLVDLTHESVMWQWMRLKRWIAEEAEQAAQLRFIQQSAQQGNPLTGLPLETASRLYEAFRRQTYWAQRYLNHDEVQQAESWILDSKRLEHKQRRRRRLIAGPVLLVVLAVIVVWIFRGQRQVAEARAIYALAALGEGSDPERSLILGLYSWGKQRTMVPGLEDFFHSALLRPMARLTLAGHTGLVRGVAWSPDSSKVATASDDRTAKVWDAATGRVLLTLPVQPAILWSVTWSPDGRKIATSGRDNVPKIWDATSGQELGKLVGSPEAISDIVWSPDGKRIATASDDGVARIWDAETGRVLDALPDPATAHQDTVSGIAWSPDSKKLATGGSNGTLEVWDAAKGEKLFSASGHDKPIRSVAWSRDGRRLATASDDKTGRTWDADTGRVLQVLRGHKDSVRGIAWSPDSRYLVTTSDDETAKVWDPDKGWELATLLGHKDALRDVSWSPDGSKIATVSFDKTAKIWRAPPGRELVALVGHGDAIWSIAWSPDKSKLATASADGTARVWDAGTGKALLTLPSSRPGSIVFSVAWSPDGSKLASADDNGATSIWDTTNGNRLQTLAADREWVRSIAWSPDGTRLATASSDKKARVWDWASGQVLITFSKHQDGVRSIAWSPDGTKLATASSDNTAKLWEAATGKELQTLVGHEAGVWGVAWSPNGDKVATASYDHSARVWKVSSGVQLLNLQGHKGRLWSVAWSPEGSTLATAADDDTAKIWDANSGEEVLTLHGHQDSVFSVAWSQDGKQLASAGADGIGQVYAIDHTQLLHLVRSRITRSLTPEECRQFLNQGKCPALPDVPKIASEHYQYGPIRFF